VGEKGNAQEATTSRSGRIVTKPRLPGFEYF
jgi:hypothetical protein